MKTNLFDSLNKFFDIQPVWVHSFMLIDPRFSSGNHIHVEFELRGRMFAINLQINPETFDASIVKNESYEKINGKWGPIKDMDVLTHIHML